MSQKCSTFGLGISPLKYTVLSVISILLTVSFRFYVTLHCHGIAKQKKKYLFKLQFWFSSFCLTFLYFSKQESNFNLWVSIMWLHTWLNLEVKGELEWPMVRRKTIPGISAWKRTTPPTLSVGGALADPLQSW